MPDNIDVKLAASDSSPVNLPSGASATNSQFSREGMDLYLTSPGGHAVKIEGYFAHDPAPDLMSADGARLSPQMVDAFLPAQHPHEVASNEAPAANDSSAVGKITEIVGDASVIHTDGTHVKAAVGTAVHMGDVVETSAKGAVHILFSDNTTFAISESARLSIDNYAYNPQAHTGTSFFSMLHGVFVYTSGLIGKDDPGNVNIETPVGSIGIRGTVVAGNIADAGQPSTITIVDGAIVVSNGGGTLQMSSAFDTVTLNGYSTAPADGGALSPQTFTSTYSAVAPADPGFYALTGTAPPPGTIAPHQAPAPTTGPDGMTQAAPDHGTATDVVLVKAVDPTHTDTAITLTDPTVATPVSDTSFTDTKAATFGTTAAGTTTFTDTLPTAGASTSTGVTTGATATAGDAVTVDAGGGKTGSSGGGGTVGPPVSATFNFAEPYLNGTPGTSPTQTADDGLPLFGLTSLFSTQPWNTLTAIGQVNLTGLAPTSYSLSGAGVTDQGGGKFYVSANTLDFNTSTTSIFGDTIGATRDVLEVDISTGGVVSVKFLDPLGVIANIQAGGTFPDFTITATDGTTNAMTQQFHFQIQSAGYGALSPVIQLGDEQGVGAIDNFTATGGNNIMWGKDGNDSFIATAGNNLIIADTGNDFITIGGGVNRVFGGDGNDTIVMVNPGFLSDGASFVDGGNGSDILRVGVLAGAPQTYNFEGVTNVKNIETLEIAGGLTTTNIVKLDFQDIFDMTSGPSHTLTIQNNGTLFGSSVTIDTLNSLSQAELTGPATIVGSLTGAGNVQIHGTLLSNGQSVTLIIDKGNGLSTDGISVALN